MNLKFQIFITIKHIMNKYAVFRGYQDVINITL
jgi:hypothetical protein